MEHDPDDPPPGPDYWGFLNRYAEGAAAAEDLDALAEELRVGDAHTEVGRGVN
jgi:hypothetical protein